MLQVLDGRNHRGIGTGAAPTPSGDQTDRPGTSGPAEPAPGVIARRSRRWRLPTGASPTGLVILLAPAIMTMLWLASDSLRSDPVGESDELPGAGIIVRSEMIHLWLPETIRELACILPRSQVLRDHDDLRRFLECRHRQDVWYAVTMRGYQAGGGFADVTFIRRPYEHAQHFAEFLDALARAGGRPACATSECRSVAAVHTGSEVWEAIRGGHPSQGWPQPD